MVWNEIIACYLFLAGMGAGAYVFAILAGWKNPDARRTKLTGMIIGLAAVALGTLLLVFDAKAGFSNPLRFFALLSNPTSVMSWGTGLLSLFLLLDFIEIILQVRSGSTPRVIDIVGIVLAIGVAVYTGLLLGAALGYPLWNIGILPILFLVSAASAGCAAALIGGFCIAKDEGKTITFYRKPALLLPLIECALIALLLAVTATTSGSAAAAATQSVAALLSGKYAPVFWGGLILVGLCVPFILEFRTRTAESGTNTLIGAQVCVLIGGFLLRYLVIMAAVPVTF